MALDKPSIGIGVVLRSGNDVLLIQRGTPPNKGQWSIPGGKQQLGETIRQAAVREILEETNFTIQEENLKLLDVADLIQLPHFHYSLIDFTCDEFSGELQAGSDAMNARWVSVDRLEEFNLWTETHKLIVKAFQDS